MSQRGVVGRVLSTIMAPGCTQCQVFSIQALYSSYTRCSKKRGCILKGCWNRLKPVAVFRSIFGSALSWHRCNTILGMASSSNLADNVLVSPNVVYNNAGRDQTNIFINLNPGQLFAQRLVLSACAHALPIQQRFFKILMPVSRLSKAKFNLDREQSSQKYHSV